MMNKVDTLLKKRTFHHSEFQDIECLLQKKKELGLTISLCLPTLNESKTIGKEVILLKSELKDRYPLLDEIAVIDSGSTDNTLEIAKKFGADTYLASDCLKKLGEQKGKGENLWKALYLLKGDIIVYIDADIQNIHPKFIYGLIGPMLFEPKIQFVKAFYDRPLSLPNNVRTSGGGRVTEILIRPLFSQFYPDLAGVIQPLSGEYAGYRHILEQLSFPVGYGVETSTLIDIYQKWGVDIIAQTDLDKRIHQNQSTKSLGKMSFGILQTFFNRLPKTHGIKNLSIQNFDHLQIQFDEENNPYTHFQHIEEFERPPMITLSEYKNRPI